MHVVERRSKKTAKMTNEIQCACEFLSRVLQARNLPVQFIKPFRVRLQELMTERFRDHWDTENPHRGSAYRCIRINGRLDPVIKEAAKVTGLTGISQYLPTEFTMWIDPHDVSYRFGEDGSICSCPLAESDVSVAKAVSSQWESGASTKARPKLTTATGAALASATKYVSHNMNISSHLDNLHQYAIPVQV